MKIALSSREILELAAQIKALGMEPFRGLLYRNLDETWRANGLLGIGSSKHGARWNPVGLSAIYFCGDQLTPLYEIGAIKDGPHGPQSIPLGPRTTLSVDATLQAVVDLRKQNQRKKIDLTNEELRADWRGLASSTATQFVGSAADVAGLEAIVVPSVARKDGWNLVVFPERLRPGSFLRTLHSTRREDTIEGR